MDEASGHSLQQRWERVARSYLRPAPVGAFRLAVAGVDDGLEVSRLAAELRRCVAELGLPLQPSPHASWVEIVELGGVDERRLGELALERSGPIDLLVWRFVGEGAPGPRALYLMGVFAWAKAAAELACVVGGRPTLDRELELLAAAGLTTPVHLHLLPPSPADAADAALKGLVQAALARADARRRLAAAKG